MKTKICLIMLLTTLSISCHHKEKPDQIVNGIMIDCARLLERKEYYFHLIDFMADWDMNTLLLHFSDDHGLSVQIPGYEKLARPNAFTPQEIKSLASHGKKKGIDVIPELEVFGHTRYITDYSDYEDLYVGEKTNEDTFNAINPLDPRTIDLMESLITKVADLFPSKYFHIGCDEVDLSSLCQSKGLDEATVWTNYVNQMINIVHRTGKMPMIWDDHLRNNDQIAEMLDKNVVLIEWNYEPEYRPTGLDTLLKMGYKEIIMAPSLACYRLRVLPSYSGLQNTNAMAEAVRDQTASGLINTIWLPMRYLQNAMWYSIAYSGYLIHSGKSMNLTDFHREFSRKVFDIELTGEMDDYLVNWTKLHLHRKFYGSIIDADFSCDPEELITLQDINDLSRGLKDNPPDFQPKQNAEILQSMVLATKVIYAISEGLLILNHPDQPETRISEWKKELDDVLNAVDNEWDKGRYPDDPNKYKARFSNQEDSHLLIVLQKLKQASLERTKL